MPASFIEVKVDEKQLARVTKRLDQFQGLPLKQLMLKIEKAAANLYYVKQLKSRASVHTRSPAERAAARRRLGSSYVPANNTEQSIGVRGLRNIGREIVAYRVGPTTWYRHFAIGGTDQGVAADPYVDQVREQQESSVVGFIAEQVRRLT